MGNGNYHKLTSAELSKMKKKRKKQKTRAEILETV